MLTELRAESVIAETSAFLEVTRGAPIDGGFASRQVAERVVSNAEWAETLLTSIAHPKHPSLYVPLSAYNADYYQDAVAVLPGHIVLVPSSLLEPGAAAFYPAVVSEDSLTTGSLRLHVLRQPFRRQLGYGTATILSAAGQSETKGIGSHDRTIADGVEAEHFATLLATGSDARLQAAWRAGQHVNHSWRAQPQNAVITEASSRLFGDTIPQATITISEQQVASGKAMLFWHEGLRNKQTGQPETATRDQALVIVQGLGYEALRTANPAGLEAVKRLLA